MVLGESPEGVGLATLASSVYGDASSLSRRRVTSLLVRLIQLGSVRRIDRGKFALSIFGATSPSSPAASDQPVDEEPEDPVDLELQAKERAERAGRERKLFALARRQVDDAVRRRCAKTVAIFGALRGREGLSEALSVDQVSKLAKISFASASARMGRLHHLGLADRYYAANDESVYLLSDRCRRMLGEDLRCASGEEELR